MTSSWRGPTNALSLRKSRRGDGAGLATPLGSQSLASPEKPCSGAPREKETGKDLEKHGRDQ